MRHQVSKWKVLLLALTLVLANVSLGASLLRSQPQQGGACCSTCICWCGKSGDQVPVGSCSSLGRGEACGQGNGGTGSC